MPSISGEFSLQYDVPVLQKDRDKFKFSAGAEKILHEIGEGEFAEVEIIFVAVQANSQTCAKLCLQENSVPMKQYHSPNAPLMREHDLHNPENELAAAFRGGQSTIKQRKPVRGRV